MHLDNFINSSGLGQMGQTLAQVPVAVGLQMAVGFVTFPARVVNDAWAFGTATRECAQGKRSGWDVAYHGLGVAADMLGIGLILKNSMANKPFSERMTPDEAARYEAYWQKNAPKQVSPGPSRLYHVKMNGRTGRMEHSRVMYDNYGRQIYRIDYTDHMRPSSHTNPHLHQYLYGPGYEHGWGTTYSIQRR